MLTAFKNHTPSLAPLISVESFLSLTTQKHVAQSQRDPALSAPLRVRSPPPPFHFLFQRKKTAPSEAVAVVFFSLFSCVLEFKRDKSESEERLVGQRGQCLWKHSLPEL